MSDSYKFVFEGGVGEIEEKKSRFIATVRPVTSEEEAVAFFNEMKKKYWDARHNCTAMSIGEGHKLTRSNDDGEPAGTAGHPMLDVLLREDIHDVAVVVTRYFGGVLLGTGGLVRAYQGAVQAGLASSTILERVTGRKMTITTDYTSLGKIQYVLASVGITNPPTEYTDSVIITPMVAEDLVASVSADLTNVTSGQAQIALSDPISYAIHNGEVVVLA